MIKTQREKERRRCRTDLKIRDSRVWNVKIRVCNAIDKKQSIYIEYQCERVPKFTHPWCRWLDWTSYKRWILGRIGNRKLYLFRRKKEHIRPRKKISKRSLEIITQRPKISSRLQSLFFQGVQECPVPATLPSCSAWTWYFRKPNTSGSLSIRVVVLTTFTNKCCVKPSQVWDIGWRFLFSEIHSGPCLTAGCSALALWLRPSRLELQSYFFGHHPTIFTKGGRLLWASSLQTEEHQRE